MAILEFDIKKYAEMVHSGPDKPNTFLEMDLSRARIYAAMLRCIGNVAFEWEKDKWIIAEEDTLEYTSDVAEELFKDLDYINEGDEEEYLMDVLELIAVQITSGKGQKSLFEK